MLHIRKGLLFTLFLAFIAVAEVGIAAYDLMAPRESAFVPETVEIEVPERKVVVAPFVFEGETTDKTEAFLDSFAQETMYTLMNQIAASTPYTVAEPQATETAPEDEEEHEVLVSAEEKADAVKPVEKRGSVLVAVVIDDMGISVPHTKDILSLEKPMTAAFLTYGAAGKIQATMAKNAGFEVILHTPMMPHVPADLAPVTLSPDMDGKEIKDSFLKMLARYEGVGMKGINNHMGSRFTEDAESLGYVMEILRDRKMYFLDSKTTSKSVGKETAEKYGVPYIARDVFLDNENNYDYVMKQLRKTEKIAHMRGYAVAIGHPRSQTYNALKNWVKDLDERHVRLVHLRDLVREIHKK